MNNFDVIIIGGGASGSVCASMLSKHNKSICVIDAGDSLAKKLLVTGNGRCNITNTNMDSSFYNQNIDGFLSVFNQNNTIDFFNSLGVEIYADEQGRCYPISNTAKSVVFALQHSCKNVQTVLNSKVNSLEKHNDYFVVKTDNQSYTAKDVILATGYNDSINSIVKDFGIKTKPYNPSLVAVKTKQSTHRLDGLRVSDVTVTATVANQQKTQFGEVLFKKDGLSGICIFNLSTLFAQNGFNGKITLDILPKISKDKLIDILNKNLKIYDNILDCLICIMHKELAHFILKQSNILHSTNCNMLTNEQIYTIANNIKNLQFDVVSSYNNNQVFSGGILLNELTKGLQSKNHHGLYFCGEVCDVDGECGGYNLQWAFTSAYVVTQDILSK